MNKNVKTALIIGGIILGVIITLPLVFGAISGWPYGGWGMMGPGMMTGFGWMWLMPVFWIVFLGLIIWAVVAAVRGSSGSRGSDFSKADSALELLKRRYARGEIDKQEYEEKKKELV
ncbi:MAG: SHOCT domain-containing protein [Chloroflexota bacterium]